MGPLQADWTWLLWILAALSMTVGNVVALVQPNLKRLLAYSSIAHVGYMLVGSPPACRSAAAACSSTSGCTPSPPWAPSGRSSCWSGTGGGGRSRRLRRPGRAPSDRGLGLTVFLLALVGMPPTAGFVGKFYLFSAAIQRGLRRARGDRRPELRRGRVLLPAPHRLHVHARARGGADGGGRHARRRRSPSSASAWATLQLGLWPGPVLTLAQHAVTQVLPVAPPPAMPATPSSIRPGLPAPISHYSNGVRVGDTVYVSGQVALDGEGRLVGPGDVVAQTRQVLENIRRVLAAGGATLDDVVKVTVFLANVDDRPRVNEVRQAYFGANRPASTLVEVSRLAFPGLLVEIEAVAVVSPRS